MANSTHRGILLNIQLCSKLRINFKVLPMVDSSLHNII